MGHSELMIRAYYQLKPLIPRRLQIWLRRKVILQKRRIYSDIWPILEKAGEKPAGWSGWPHHRQFALVLTHDVESEAGQQKCLKLMTLEKHLGFRSSFNFVPKRYNVSPEIRQTLTDNGFEVGVHGLKHDGKLYQSRRIFQERAYKINNYLRDWDVVGFRSPAAHHNLDWIRELRIEYDASTFDTDPFEPQPDGMLTIFPFWIQGYSPQEGYVELPYTLPQDFTLFILMQEKCIDIWRQKLDWIVEKGGMALMVTHPDYMGFDENKLELEEFPVDYYLRFLDYIKTEYQGQYWHPLPRDMARWWRARVC